MKRRSSFTFFRLIPKRSRISQLRKFYEFYYRGIYTFVFELVKDEAQVEEIIIEVFVRLGKTKIFFFNIQGVERFLYGAAWDACFEYFSDPELIRKNNVKLSNLIRGEKEEMISEEMIGAGIFAYLKKMEEEEIAKHLNIRDKRVTDLRHKALKSLRSAILKRVAGRAIYR